ncbi:MAG: imidazole glycerol phosphate synthase subunit HisH [Flavobacteriaceae bacterium]|nr:imidazole glycerol phosphate synthase subunit HisH [Flavobacteriaceae bacterium]
MKIVVIDYGSGNVQSVQFSLQRLGYNALISSDQNEIQSADRVIFPGVGHAHTAINNLKKNNLVELIKQLNQPVLGICLGMQLMCNQTEEGNVKGLGIFDTCVKKFQDLKVPQIGWNRLSSSSAKYHNNYVYMIHSYYAEICEQTKASCTYGINYSAVLQKNNFTAFQFHPEKSSQFGAKLINEFIIQK